MKRALAAVAMSLFLPSCSHLPVKEDRVCFQKNCLDVEVVSTPETMAKGLQHRVALGEDEGMLFVFSYEGRHMFWMKETLIPLDMIWMDRERRIEHIESNVQPCKADPCEVYDPMSDDILYVLETSAGYSAKHELKKGDQADFYLKD